MYHAETKAKPKSLATKRRKKLDPATATAGEYADDVVRILHLYVSPYGTKAWRIRLRAPGERAKRHTLGHFPEMSHEEARTAALIARPAIRRGADPKTTLAAREPRTVEEAIKEYLASPMVTGHQKKVVTKVYKDSMRRALRVPTGNGPDHFAAIRAMPLKEVSRRDLETLKDMAPTEYMRKLRVFFSWCVSREYIDTSPAANVRLPKSRTDTRALIANSEGGGIDWRELVAVMRGLELFAAEKPDSLWPSVYRLQLFTATRPDEVTRLRWEDVELESEFPMLGVNGKTGHRDIPLTRAAVNVLQQIQPDAEKRHGFVFPGVKGDSGHLTEDGAVHRRILKLAGSKRPWSRKHLRKTVRTWFGARRQDVLGRLALGHSLQGMDAHYDGSDPRTLIRKAMNEFCDELAAQTKAPTPGLRLVA